jgi:hypothetical protein
MKECFVGAEFISSQIQNPIAAWNGRITCMEVMDRGFKFRREHPYYEGETFVLSQENLDKSFWIPSSGRPSEPAKLEFWAARLLGHRLPDWSTLSIEPVPPLPCMETVKVTIEPQFG